MSFTQNTFAPIGPQSTAAPSMFSYSTADTLAALTTSGYFVDKQFQLNAGDIIFTQHQNGFTILEVGSSTDTAEIPSLAGDIGYILVTEKDDFPEPSGGIITLEVARYYIKGDIDLTGDFISMTGGSSITGDTVAQSSITTSSASPTITASNGGFQACGLIGNAGLKINNSGTGAAVRIEDSDTILFAQNLFTSAAGNGLELDGVGGFGMENWTFTAGVTNGCVMTGTNPRTIMRGFNAGNTGSPVSGKGIDIQGPMSGTLLLMTPIIVSVDSGIECDQDIAGIGITDGSVTSTEGTAFLFTGSTVGAIRVSGARIAGNDGDAMDVSGADKISTMIYEAANLFASGAGNACFRTDADSADNIDLGADFSITSFLAVAGATALVNATKKDIVLGFGGCIGSSAAVNTEIANSNPIGCYTLSAQTTTTINTVNVWERVGGTTATCATLERFSQTANNTLQYDGLNNFSGVPHATFTVEKGGATKTYEFSFGVDTGSGPVIDTSSIMTSEVKTTLVPLSIVSSADFAIGDDIGVFVRNISDDDDIIFDAMNVVIK